MDKKELWDKINTAYKADKSNNPSWPDHVLKGEVINIEQT